MKALELRDLLAALPDDTVVLINGKHVEYVYRQHARRWPAMQRKAVACECGDVHRCVVGKEYIDLPASIDLGSRLGTPGADRPAPIVEFHGRWTKAARAAIDRHSEDPDA